MDFDRVFNAAPGVLEEKLTGFFVTVLALREAGRLKDGEIRSYLEDRITKAPVFERNKIVDFLKGLK